MDEIDCRILQALQDDFPLSERPYEVIAEKLNMPTRELWARVERLIDKGIIRRIAASLDSGKLGFCSTLAAVSIKQDSIEQATQIIGAFPEVTHCYLRKARFNIWFTIIAADNERIEHILEHIRSSLPIDRSEMLNLPVKRMFKLDTRFNMFS